MKKLLGVLAVLMLMAGSAFAQVQAGQGALAGMVEDSTKAAIPGAKVILTNPGIGLHEEATTNSAGGFSFSPLTVIGGYMLHVTAPGFDVVEVKSIETSVGTVITQNVILAVGKADVVVEVTSVGEEQVQTNTSSVSQLIDQQIWQESPLSVRDSNSFVGLVAGAAGDAGGTGRGFAVNGARTGTGDFVVEGFDDNDQGLGGAAIATMSPDAIQEYRVVTSVPNAEYGRAGGFATDTVLKSGTKKLHGSAFEYNRIQALAQENWFNSFTTPKLRDHLVRNQFGGSFGGPIYKDRTFFYATAEFQRQRSGTPTTYVAPTQAFYDFVKSGAFETWAEGTTQQNNGTNPENPTDGSIGIGLCPEYNGAPCPGALSDVSTTGPVFNKNYAEVPTEFPFATDNFTNEFSDIYLGGGLGLPVLFAPVDVFGNGHAIDTDQYNQNRGSLKIDHKLTEKDQLSFSYVLDLHNETASQGGGETTPGLPYINVGGGQLFGSRWTHTFTPNLVTEGKGNYTRHVNNFTAAGPQGVPGQFAEDANYTGFGVSTGFPQLFTENEFVYAGNVTYTHHTHTFKAGGGFTRTRNGSSFYNDQYGTLAFWSTPGLMTDGLFEHDAGNATGLESEIGDLAYATASQDPSTGGAPNPYRGYRANEFNAYIQDDWKATPRLFINIGVRWDYFGPPHNFQSGYDSNVFFGGATTVTSTNPFAPGGSLYLGEQSGGFRCVGFQACGNPDAATAAGFAPAANRSTIWDRDTNNIGPRLGFSYDALGNQKLVVRGGFGIGYDRLYNNVYENIRFNAPRFVDNETGADIGSAPILGPLRAGLVTSPFTGNNLLSGAGPVPRHINQNLKTAYYEQIHFGVESSVKGYVLEANYIGTLGRQLVGIMNINTFEGRTACPGTTTTAAQIAQTALCAAAGFANGTLSSARPNPAFASDNFRTNGFSSNYSGGQVSIRKGYGHGFQFNANYTFSKAMDQISDVFTVKSGATGITTPYNPSHVYGPSDFDTRHLAKLNLNYQTQSEKHKLLLAGWGISPIVTLQSGNPIYIKDSSAGYDPNKDGTTGVEPAVYKGTGSIKNSIIHGASLAGTGSKGTGYIKLGSWGDYVCPANVNNGIFCDVPGDRQSLYGPRGYNVDLAVSKHIHLYDRFNLTLQASFFDVDGHVEWSQPVGDINSSQFGNSTSTIAQREGQLSGRIDF